MGREAIGVRNGGEAGRVGLVTSAELSALTPDDRRLLAPLERRGFAPEPLVWEAPPRPLAEYAGVVIRSCWDYHLRVGAFLEFVAAVEAAGVPLLNPGPVVRWNADKAYLRDLERAGILVAPTRFVGRGRSVRLSELLDAAGWDEAVLKPAVSASGYRTVRTSRARAGDDQAVLDVLLADGDALVQAFVPEVVSAGEWSLVFLGGAYSHAVIKRARPGEFRVHEEHGGEVRPGAPPAGCLADAEAAVARFAPGCAYARVDGVERAGRLMLIELELIEPALYLEAHPDAPERLAAAIVQGFDAARSSAPAGSTATPGA